MPEFLHPGKLYSKFRRNKANSKIKSRSKDWGIFFYVGRFFPPCNGKSNIQQTQSEIAPYPRLLNLKINPPFPFWNWVWHLVGKKGSCLAYIKDHRHLNIFEYFRRRRIYFPRIPRAVAILIHKNRTEFYLENELLFEVFFSTITFLNIIPLTSFWSLFSAYIGIFSFPCST